jgi:hypothetical protein
MHEALDLLILLSNNAIKYAIGVIRINEPLL